MQGYTDSEDFFISPLGNKDVILGAPWFHRVYAKLECPSRVITLSSRDREIKIRIEEKGHIISIVSSVFHSKVNEIISFCVYDLSTIVSVY